MVEKNGQKMNWRTLKSLRNLCGCEDNKKRRRIIVNG